MRDAFYCNDETYETQPKAEQLNLGEASAGGTSPPFHRQYTRLTSSILFAMQGFGYSQYQTHSPHHQRSGELPKLYYKSLDHGTDSGGFNGPACMNSSSTYLLREDHGRRKYDTAADSSSTLGGSSSDDDERSNQQELTARGCSESQGQLSDQDTDFDRSSYFVLSDPNYTYEAVPAFTPDVNRTASNNKKIHGKPMSVGEMYAQFQNDEDSTHIYAWLQASLKASKRRQRLCEWDIERLDAFLDSHVEHHIAMEADESYDENAIREHTKEGFFKELEYKA
ncbi:hypothetical protein PHYSODRAFT_331542 [Phytophthora sojae]|uniref:Uncharacterized protein n=1 Tax=Phytophthora sojae (strain P6497) TaxID=1094619 RepID=G4ZHD5_PHYSP|nr:hypothetical protein PHYSODRAFT_331542 [Phytophthora sojae]EGZ17605.1 hypothetical protein PHYSODRAFT_331542 [Phytophthora sojae]|eukprot:XP_009526663.1 hypothetical protein PHYSODRAFT_331542 [Phytophthora sojae]